MSRYILYYKGAYNIYSTIIDRPIFSEALTLEELKQYTKEEEGNQGLKSLPSELEQAHKKGTGSRFGLTLIQGISNNHAGTNGERLSSAEFITKFLVLKRSRADAPKITCPNCKSKYTDIPKFFDIQGNATLEVVKCINCKKWFYRKMK